MPRITPMLWFDTQAEEAAHFYTSIFPNSEIKYMSHYTESGPRERGMVLTVVFTLDGEEFQALNGGPEFTFDEAISFVVPCADQAEIDRYWAALSDGGEEGVCGWLKDRFGVSWQVVPDSLDRLLTDPDEGRRDRAMAAVLRMKKLDLAEINAAADAVPVSA